MEIPEDKPQRRKLISSFDKIALLFVLLIIGYIISAKLGCEAIKKEEKVEWIQ